MSGGEKTIGDVVRAAADASGRDPAQKIGVETQFTDLLQLAAKSAATAEQRRETVRRILQVVDAGGNDELRDTQADYLLEVIDRVKVHGGDLSAADIDLLRELRDKLVANIIKRNKAARETGAKSDPVPAAEDKPSEAGS